jgi:signal transduction histidine kinase
MHQHLTQSADPRSLPDDDRLSLERQILALNALSKLTKQFSQKPDFRQLIEVLLMTLCGQFSVADSFAILQNPDSYGMRQFSATGKFKNSFLLASLHITAEHRKYFLENPSALRVEQLEASSESAQLAFMLATCKVALLCPLVHNDKCFGIIGLGERVSKKRYGQQDQELLITIINTITPFLANSHLFSEVTRLNFWYLDILNSVKQGVFVFDKKNRLKKINSSGLSILKVFRPDIADSDTLYLAPIELIFPYTKFGDWAKRFVQAGKESISKSLGNMLVGTKGAQRVYSVSISRNTENPGIERDLIIILDDVTAQKEREQRLFDLQKFADKGLMASSISHELNNFLGLILGGVEITQMALHKGDGEKANATLDKLKANVASMERFTARLMDYAKFDTSKQSANLNYVITDILSFVSLQKRFKQLEIIPELDSNLPEFPLDIDQITQVLLNLLNNAADAITELDREKGRITVTTIYDKNDVVLSVSDNGVGIKPEVKGKLFRSRFTTKEKGHGYGLMMCKKIIEDHGGSITIDSRVGIGSTFTIRFPITN